MSGALIGIAGAIGAFGGVLVNLAFRQSFLRPAAVTPPTSRSSPSTPSASSSPGRSTCARGHSARLATRAARCGRRRSRQAPGRWNCPSEARRRRSAVGWARHDGRMVIECARRPSRRVCDGQGRKQPARSPGAELRHPSRENGEPRAERCERAQQLVVDPARALATRATRRGLAEPPRSGTAFATNRKSRTSTTSPCGRCGAAACGPGIGSRASPSTCGGAVVARIRSAPCRRAPRSPRGRSVGLAWASVGDSGRSRKPTGSITGGSMLRPACGDQRLSPRLAARPEGPEPGGSPA